MAGGTGEVSQWNTAELGCLGKTKSGGLIWRFQRQPYYLRRIFRLNAFEIAIYMVLDQRKTYGPKEVDWRGSRRPLELGSVYLKSLGNFRDELALEGIRISRVGLQRLLKKWQVMSLVDVQSSRARDGAGTIIRFKKETEIPALKAVQESRMGIKCNAPGAGNPKQNQPHTMADLPDQDAQWASLGIKMNNKLQLEMREIYSKKIVATLRGEHQKEKVLSLRLKLLYLRGEAELLDQRIGRHNISSTTSVYPGLDNLTDDLRYRADAFPEGSSTFVPEFFAGSRVDDDDGGNNYNRETRRQNRFGHFVELCWKKVARDLGDSEKLEEIKRTRELREVRLFSNEQIARGIYMLAASGELGKGTWITPPVKALLDRLHEFEKLIEVQKQIERRLQLRVEIQNLEREIAEIEGRLQGEGVSYSDDAVQTPPACPL